MKRTLLLVCVATLALSGTAAAQTYPQDPASAPAPTPAPAELPASSAEPVNPAPAPTPSLQPASAPTPTLQPAPTAATVSGVVISTTPEALVIETTPGTQMTFVVDSASTLPTGLTPSTHVTVQYHPLAGGTFHAATVSVDSAPDAALESGAAASSTYSTGSTATALDTDADLVDQEMDEMDTLPATASTAPLAGLAGLLALGAAALLRATRRR